MRHLGTVAPLWLHPLGGQGWRSSQARPGYRLQTRRRLLPQKAERVSFPMSLARTSGLSPDSLSVTRGGPWDRKDIGDRAQGAAFSGRQPDAARRVTVIAQTRRRGCGRRRRARRRHQQDPRPSPPSPRQPPRAPRGYRMATTLTQPRARGEGGVSPMPHSFIGKGTWVGVLGPLVARQGCPRSAEWGESSRRMVYY